MITYSCNETDQRGVCLPDKMSVFVSSRERSISDEKKESLIPVLNQLCVNPDTLIRYNDDGELLTLIIFRFHHLDLCMQGLCVATK